MKCIRLVGQGCPVRMPDADAFHIVHRDKDGEYCPKHVWKKFYTANYWMERGGLATGYGTLKDFE